MATVISRSGVRNPCAWRSVYVSLLIDEAVTAPSDRAAATIMQCNGYQTNHAAPPLLNNLDAKALFPQANEVWRSPL